MLVMTHDEIQSLVAGYALGILDDEEKKIFEEHLPGCPICQADLAPLQGIADDLALSLDPKPLPIGHLERFRAKAKEVVAPETVVDNPPVTPVTPPVPTPAAVPAGQSEFEQAQARRNQRTGRFGRTSPGGMVAYAAALVLFVAAALFGYFLIDANNKLSERDTNARALATLLTSPTLKVTELQPTNTGQKSTARLLTDSSTNQAVLVSQDLEALPADKAYQVWLIGADGKPQSAAVFARTDKSEPAVIALAPPGSVSQYKVVAITVEKSGGSTSGPTTQPFTAGNIT